MKDNRHNDEITDYENLQMSNGQYANEQKVPLFWPADEGVRNTLIEILLKNKKQIPDNEIQQSLADVKLTGKCVEEDQLAQIQTVPQSTKEIVNELKGYAQRDKYDTDAEIERIQQEIHRLKTVGINSDQTEEEKGVFAYYDAVAEVRRIAELEKELKQLTEPSIPTVAEVYNSLEEIREAMNYLNIQCDLMMPIKNDTMHYMECEFTRKIALMVTEKLQKTIDNGSFIQTDGTK